MKASKSSKAKQNTLDWKNYEREIFDGLKMAYRDADVVLNKKVVGRHSQRIRQIDVFVEGNVFGQNLNIAVEAKHLSKKVDVKAVETFIAMLDDIGVSKGILITNKGYSQAALLRPYNDKSSKVELDVLSLAELKNHQGFGGIPYAGNTGLAVGAPFGWVLDNTRTDRAIAHLYRRGEQIHTALENFNVMYINFWRKDSQVSSAKDLVHKQTEDMYVFYNVPIEERGTRARLLEPPTRLDGNSTCIREFLINEESSELAGYTENGEWIFFFVLLTKATMRNRNLDKLKEVVQFSVPVSIEKDNTVCIKRLKQECSAIQNKVEKAEKYAEIAWYYNDMSEYGKADEYRILCAKNSPAQHDSFILYKNTRILLVSAIKNQDADAFVHYALKLFAVAPTNPLAMQDIFLACQEMQNEKFFNSIVDVLKVDYTDQKEPLAIVTMYEGLYSVNNGDRKYGIRILREASKLFQEVDEKHLATKSIKSTLTCVNEMPSSGKLIIARDASTDQEKWGSSSPLVVQIPSQNP